MVMPAKPYFEFDKSTFVVVDITVVGSGENCDHCRKVLLSVPLVHFVAFDLGLVSSDQREELVAIHELVDCFDTREKSG